MGRIRYRRAALQDGRDHALRTRGDRGAVDHQIQPAHITGHASGVDQRQHDIAPILIEQRHIRRDNRVLVRPTVGTRDTDRAAVQRQVCHRHHAASLGLWRCAVKDQGTAAQI
ncbi:Uncharacterised protein [Yersinia enterocolitica]|nr:Uncharacterised protein [Yersinia enterocolitica]